MAYREGKLSQLPAEKQEEIVALARRCRLLDIVESLEKEGVEISISGLSRFVKKVEERRLLEDAKEESEAMEALAAGRDRKKFRKGTLAMLQSRLYDEALKSGDLATIQKCYQQLAAEEDRAEGLELDRRRLELAAINAEVGRRRLEIAMETAKGKRRVVVETAATEQVSGGKTGEKKLLTGGNRENGEENCHERSQGSQKLGELEGVLRAVKEALNRGGDAAEKVLEARTVLGG